MTTFDAKRAVTDLLRPSEKAILVVDTSPDGGASGNPRSPPFQTTRRVLAIVLHESHEQNHGACVTVHKHWLQFSLSEYLQAICLQMDQKGASLTRIDGYPCNFSSHGDLCCPTNLKRIGVIQ